MSASCLPAPHGAAPISEAMLVDCLARAEAANEGELITLFEITAIGGFGAGEAIDQKVLGDRRRAMRSRRARCAHGN